MADETKKTQESELADEQLEEASGGYIDEFQSFRTLSPAAQAPETAELPLKEDGESRATTDVEYTLKVTDTE